MHAWVIPYRPDMHIQVRMNKPEAQQLLEELEGIEDMDEDLKLKQLKLKIEDMMERIGKLEKE